jgi:protein-disulfide isomerase
MSSHTIALSVLVLACSVRVVEAGSTEVPLNQGGELATLGPAGASVVIEVYTDYQCPYCRNNHEVMRELHRRYPQSIRIIHRDYPMSNKCNSRISSPFHQLACQAAYYARCAAEQQKFWPYVDLVFGGRTLGEDALKQHGEKLKLDSRRLSSCVQSSRVKKWVEQDIGRGGLKGVVGTPCLLVNGERVSGARDIAFWSAKVEALGAIKK